MSEIPEPKRCIELLKENGCSDAVINHCMAVRDLAVKIAKKANVNLALVEAGALLHDIGRSKTHGIKHGIKGADIAKNLNLPDEIVRIIERHIGAGIPEDEAMKLGLPPKDYLPETIEEKIVTHADNLIQSGKKQVVEREIKKALRKGQKNHAKRLLELHKELSALCGIDINDI